MFFTYIYRELRRRHRQALLTALGLAVGVALVVAVTAYAGGVSNAQDQVLHSLYGVGTDITVSQTAKLGEGGPQRFGMQPPERRRKQGKTFSRDAITQRARASSRWPRPRSTQIAVARRRRRGRRQPHPHLDARVGQVRPGVSGGGAGSRRARRQRRQQRRSPASAVGLAGAHQGVVVLASRAST